jgi:hypothetical protein
VFNMLEEAALPVTLVNALHVKQVPGRKTDVGDAVWLADLLRHGLVGASFIPLAEIRALRELTNGDLICGLIRRCSTSCRCEMKSAG